jgi:DNA-binding response OmpR family regulator
MPDLMILDLTMPMKDGYELICDIRGTPAVAHIPIMVVTAADDLVLFNKVMKAGVLGYFNKPIVPNEVITKLKELIR